MAKITANLIAENGLLEIDGKEENTLFSGWSHTPTSDEMGRFKSLYTDQLEELLLLEDEPSDWESKQWSSRFFDLRQSAYEKACALI